VSRKYPTVFLTSLMSNTGYRSIMTLNDGGIGYGPSSLKIDLVLLSLSVYVRRRLWER
jgi:hypothetical protein